MLSSIAVPCRRPNWPRGSEMRRSASKRSPQQITNSSRRAALTRRLPGRL